jgi:hypothetical protein
MPVKIVNTNTSPSTGLINKNQLEAIIDDYLANIQITAIDGHIPVAKTFSFFFDDEEFKEMLKKVEKGGGLRIRLTIHPNIQGHVACDGNNYGNYLSIAVFATDQYKNDLDGFNDFVLLPGFKSTIN